MIEKGLPSTGFFDRETWKTERVCKTCHERFVPVSDSQDQCDECFMREQKGLSADVD